MARAPRCARLNAGSMLLPQTEPTGSLNSWSYCSSQDKAEKEDRTPSLPFSAV